MTDAPAKIRAPLGSKALRFAPRIESREAAALAMIDAYFTEHPDAWLAYSGGKDSTASLDLVRRVNPWVKMVFFDSGLEFPQTLQYVRETADRFGVDLAIFPARPSALTVLENSGYWEHGTLKAPKEDLHAALITRPLADATAALGKFSVYGLRAAESRERYALLASRRGLVTHKGPDGVIDRTALAPIWQWEWNEVHAYLGRRNVPLNPIYDAMVKLGVPERRCRVGLLIDGNELEHGRWSLVRQLAPDLARVVETHLPILGQYR